MMLFKAMTFTDHLLCIYITVIHTIATTNMYQGRVLLDVNIHINNKASRNNR